MSLDASMPARMVGIDFGTKRVGIALADPLGLLAQPHGTFSQRGAVEELQRIHRREGLAVIVMGWPLTEVGEEGPSTERVQEYINRLHNAMPDVDIVKWDERYTSELAREHLKKTGRVLSRENKGQIDAAAATIILQEYLNG